MDIFTLQNINDFQSIAKKFKIEISEIQLSLFKKYLDFLLEWNEKINLISRKNLDIATILEKHFLDSIIFLPEIKSILSKENISILDIGSGGGFPAIPLAIMQEKWTFTLCESIFKKTNFLTELVKHLGLKNVKVINNRVEALPIKKYDFITSRAVGKLDELIKYSLPFMKHGAVLLAYKGPAVDSELVNIQDLVKEKKLKIEVFSKETNGFSKKMVKIVGQTY